VSVDVSRENPARIDEVVGTFTPTRPDDVAGVVAQAGEAQRGWSEQPVEARAQALRAAASHLRPALEEIAELTARETGKVRPDCLGEARFAVAVLEWYADRGQELLVDTHTDEQRGRLLLRHRPYGVVAAITPWNAPLVLTMLKLAPALVAGNAVVVKPSPLAPFGVSRMIELVAGALPAGLVRVVFGDADVATALVGDPGVHRVAFTGGDGAGRAIASLAGRSLTPSMLELGGNDPAILLPDVDLSDAALDRLVVAAFATSGQVCMAIKRLYVHESRYDDVVEAYLAAAGRVLRLGDPLHQGSTMGPVVTGASAERVRGLVSAACGRAAQALPLGSVD